MYRRIFFLILTFSIYPTIFCQNMRLRQENFLEAEYFFFSEHYADALPFYLQIYENEPDNANIAYRVGVCYLNIENSKHLSIEYLEKAVENMSAKHKEGSLQQKSAPYDALYELGRAYLINFRCDDAKATFIRFSETLLPNDKENIAYLNQQIQACDNAKALMFNPIRYTEDNLGAKINDEKDNFNPVISADGKTLAFMVSLKFYDAIMISNGKDGKWSDPVNITPELMTDGDMYISCLSKDGKTLFLSKDDNFNSDIYTSTLEGSTWTQVTKLNKNINTKYWESHGYITEDENTLFFASDRPGGFGGLDLYVSRKVNGEWGVPVNLGPEINTPFNEDRPFLINKGQTLFFSSQGHNSMGGYDIFKSTLQPNGLWDNPANIGYPINTTDDNIFFMPIDNGHGGYYSTSKSTSGLGESDICKVIFE